MPKPVARQRTETQRDLETGPRVSAEPQIIAPTETKIDEPVEIDLATGEAEEVEPRREERRPQRRDEGALGSQAREAREAEARAQNRHAAAGSGGCPGFLFRRKSATAPRGQATKFAVTLLEILDRPLRQARAPIRTCHQEAKLSRPAPNYAKVEGILRFLGIGDNPRRDAERDRVAGIAHSLQRLHARAASPRTEEHRYLAGPRYRLSTARSEPAVHATAPCFVPDGRWVRPYRTLLDTVNRTPGVTSCHPLAA
jgi:hypothetical protein